MVTIYPALTCAICFHFSQSLEQPKSILLLKNSCAELRAPISARSPVNIVPDNVDAPAVSVLISLTCADPEGEDDEVGLWGMVEYEVMTTRETAFGAERSDMESVASATRLFNMEDLEAVGIESAVSPE